MKKILFLALTFIGSVTFAFSQSTTAGGNKKDTINAKGPKLTPEQRACDQACHMMKDFDLTWAQGTKIHDAALTRETKLDELRTKPLADKAANDAAAKKIDDDYDAVIKTVLTADQYSKWLTRRQLEIQKREIKRKEDSLQGKH